VISLVLSEDNQDQDRGQPGQQHPEMGVENSQMTYGNLRLTEQFARNQLHSIARSEVYFRRPNSPTDLAAGYFARLDGQEEFGNAFNPFWNARLTEMRFVDSIAALLIQQGQDFTGASVAIEQAITGVESLFQSLSNLSIDDFLP
jgi:hypothetical protein